MGYTTLGVCHVPEKEPEKSDISGYSKAAAYMGLAFVTPVSGWVCYKLGQWLDAKLGSNYLALIGLILGCAAGMYETYRQAVRLEGLDKRPRSGKGGGG